MSSTPIASLEIGTHMVRVLVGEYRLDNQLHVTGLGEVQSSGVRKGEIVDLDNALACLKIAIKQAEEMTHKDIFSANVVFSGGHIQSVTNRGQVLVVNDDNIISRAEIDDVMNNARAINLSMNRHILHSICQHFYVDDQAGVINPEGMEGTRLSLDMLLLHGIHNRIRNTIRVVEEAQLDVEDAAFGGLCAGLAVLTTAQKEGGAIVIDIGGGTTDYVVYANKAITHAGSIAVGGDHITNDLALGLKIPTARAETLKVKEGSAKALHGHRSQMIDIPAESGYEGKQVCLHDLNTIIQYRVEELFELVKARIDRSVLKHKLSAGVILTGGGALMHEISSVAEQAFDLPCSLGKPHNVSGITQVVEGPEYAAGLGMLRYGLRNQEKEAGQTTVGGWIKRIFRA
jgi:cell division protein FtsA